MNASKRSERSLWILALLALPLMTACDSSGVVQGQYLFFQNQGNFCPAGRNCTGAKYTQAQFNTMQPFANMKIYILRQSDNQVIGTGTTNSNGFYTIQWRSPGGNLQDVPAQVQIRYEHQDGRFAIEQEGGAPWVTPDNGFVAVHGAVTNIVTTLGTAATPNQLANAYDGASKMWNNSLGQSNRMIGLFDEVSIRAWDTDADGNGTSDDCPSSCAMNLQNRILLDVNAAYMPQGRVMHEMGHIASFVASRDQSYTFVTANNNGGAYCFPAAVGNCPWTLAGLSPEWGSVVFEEGVATHLADVGLYFPGAPQPHSCIAANFCPANTMNIETSLGNACVPNQNRQVIESVRYHWDNYDSLDDFAAPASDTLSMGVWHVVDTIHALDNGTDDDEKDEPWDATYTFVDDFDGRSNVDFRQAWNTYGTNSATQLTQNCGGVGD